MSAVTAVAPPPASPATRSAASLEMSATTTVAPLPLSACTQASPSRAPPPVTRATLPSLAMPAMTAPLAWTAPSLRMPRQPQPLSVQPRPAGQTPGMDAGLVVVLAVLGVFLLVPLAFAWVSTNPRRWNRVGRVLGRDLPTGHD